ncbi:MAG: hypothetical protein P8175_00950, partial [Deltaproteobacteria bacterium]
QKRFGDVAGVWGSDPHAPALAMQKKGTCIASKITHCVKRNNYATKKLISKLFCTPVRQQLNFIRISFKGK